MQFVIKVTIIVMRGDDLCLKLNDNARSFIFIKYRCYQNNKHYNIFALKLDCLS